MPGVESQLVGMHVEIWGNSIIKLENWVDVTEMSLSTLSYEIQGGCPYLLYMAENNRILYIGWQSTIDKVYHKENKK